MLIIESINISLLGLYPWKCSCMNPFHLGRFSSLLNDKDDCQRISIPELLGTKGCIIYITGLVLDRLCTSSCSYHLIGNFFSSVMFFAFNKNLNLSMLTDSDGSHFRVLVPTAVIPIPWKVFLPSIVHTLWSLLSPIHWVNLPSRRFSIPSSSIAITVCL